MVSEPRWEEPLARPLYVTLRRAAELVDMPYERMIYAAYLLETRRFGPDGGARRVSMRSIDEFLELRETGADPLRVLAARREEERARRYEGPAVVASAPQPLNSYWRRRGRRFY